ncbi:MAG: tetratricopeptide repeat protein [Symploca sp. SIO1B1]|nr:tetratricopeptide repeat protein [Symploca sp. SIO1C2]NER98217.1 tetratricopeptide repeat protein [Symploca sp. SIO1B1]
MEGHSKLNSEFGRNPKITDTLSHVPLVLPEDTRYFTGREEQLQQLEELLLNSRGSKICSIVGVSGGGGIGKSALACHFATIHQDKFRDGVIWLRVAGKDVDTIAREFLRHCQIKLDLEDDQDAVQLMKELVARRQMLLIFDNAEEQSIKSLLPDGTSCAVMVTTRTRKLPFDLDIGERETIDLPPLPETDSLKLLKKILTPERVDNTIAAAKRLVNLVGNLPLALQVLSASLRGDRESLADYAEALEEEKEELFEELQVEGDRNLNVEASLNLSLRRLSEEETYFFACLSVCAAAGFTRQTAMAATGYTKILQTRRRLKKLYNWSLLNYVDSGENRFVLHPLVRAYAEALARKQNWRTIAGQRHAQFFVEWLQSDLEDETAVEEVAANLDDVILAAEWLQNHETDTAQSNQKNYKFALQLQPLFEQYGYWQKAITLMARFQSWAEEFEDWDAVAKYQMQEARYWSFVEEFEQAEAILDSAQGNLHKIEDLDTRKTRKVKVLNVLAGVFQKQGKFELQQGKLEQAQQAFERQIEIDEAFDNKSRLAIGLTRLGGVLQQQGKLEAAQQAFEQRIEINEALNDQPSLAIGLTRLGGVLQQQGKLEAAQQAFKQQIALSEALNDQSSVAIGLTRLGGVLQQQGKLEAAQQAFEQRIEINEALNDQPSLAIGWNRLGGVLQQQGKLEPAQQAFEREIEIDKALNDQSQLAIGLNCLGGVFQQQGKLEPAQQAFEREVEIDKTLNEQSSLAITLNRLGGVLQQQRKFEEAQQAFERGIEINENLNNQSSVVIGLNCLGGVLQQQGKLEPAQQAFEQEIAIAKDLNDQSKLAITLNRLGGVLLQQGKLEQAQQTFEQEIAITEALNNQSQLAIGWNCLGGVLLQQGQLEQAQQAFERQIEIAKALNDQSQLAIGLNCLGGLLQQQGKLEEAQQAFEQQIALSEDLNDQSSLAIGLNLLGGVLLQQGQLEEALPIARRCVAIETELGISKGLTMALTQVSQLLRATGQVQEAITTLERIAQIEEELGNQRGIAMTLSTLANLQKDHGYWDDASQTLLRILAIEEGLSNQERILSTFASLNYIALQQEKFDLAVEYYERVFELSKKSGNEEVFASTLNRMGIRFHEYGTSLLNQRGIVDQVIEILEKSQEILTYLNIPAKIAWVLHSLGRAWKLKGNFEESETLLKHSQEILEDEKDWSSLAKVLNTLGGVLERQQKWDEAENILRQSYDLAVKLEDKRGQAIVANSLGQVMAYQEEEKAFKSAQMYFRQSIKLGEEIDDHQHLAKVHTARGQAFLARQNFDEAVSSLSQGFAIDESLSNIRGLKIVTPNITYALSRLGKREDALAYCDRALKIAPDYPGFLQLYDKIQTAIATGTQEILIKTGLVLFIRYNKDKLRWGRIAPDDGSSKITFNEKFVGYESVSLLAKGDLVEVEVQERYGKLYATQIRIIEEEEEL